MPENRDPGDFADRFQRGAERLRRGLKWRSSMVWAAALALCAAGCLGEEKDSSIQFLGLDAGAMEDAGEEEPFPADDGGADPADASVADDAGGEGEDASVTPHPPDEGEDGGSVENCPEGYHYDASRFACVDNAPPGCVLGEWDGGGGMCVPWGTCAGGYHDGSDGTCVEYWRCAGGYHDGGDGTCVEYWRCAGGYHDGGDGTCVGAGSCSSGYLMDEGDDCIPESDCRTNHEASGGRCVEIVSFIPVPAGGYVLAHDIYGRAAGETVQVGAFQMGETPVTVGQFGKCVRDGGCAPGVGYVSDDGSNFCNYGRGGLEADQPMNCVTPEAAGAFCAWVGGRLPTEEEWEYAYTHDGTSWRATAYPWGDVSPEHCVHASFLRTGQTLYYCQGRTADAVKHGTSSVFSYPEGNSPLGLRDMAGNVSELTSSPYLPSNPSVVAKGGAFDIPQDVFANGGGRVVYTSGTPYRFGFRCAR